MHATLRALCFHFKGCPMKLRFLFSVLILGTMLIASGCAKPEFEASAIFDPLATFPPEATIAWNDEANHLPANPELQSIDYDRLIKLVSNQEFAKRGYNNAAPGSSDYWISYELTVHRWISAEKSRATGTLSLTLVDTSGNNRVWLGFGRAQVLVGLSEEERIERLRVILTEILETFPPDQHGR